MERKWDMNEIKVTGENFNTAVAAAAKPVLLDFWASWCGPCKMLAPLVHELAAKHPEIDLGSVNVDEEPALAIRFGVMSIPTLILMKDGAEVRRLVGLQREEALERFIEV